MSDEEKPTEESEQCRIAVKAALGTIKEYCEEKGIPVRRGYEEDGFSTCRGLLLNFGNQLEKDFETRLKLREACDFMWIDVDVFDIKKRPVTDGYQCEGRVKYTIIAENYSIDINCVQKEFDYLKLFITTNKTARDMVISEMNELYNLTNITDINITDLVVTATKYESDLVKQAKVEMITQIRLHDPTYTASETEVFTSVEKPIEIVRGKPGMTAPQVLAEIIKAYNSGVAKYVLISYTGEEVVMNLRALITEEITPEYKKTLEAYVNRFLTDPRDG